MKTKSIKLTALRNEEHFMFLTEVQALLAGAQKPVKKAVGQAEAQLLALLARENVVLDQIRRSGYTDRLAELDARRDALYTGLSLLTQAYLRSPVPAEAAAAEHLMQVLRHYGKVAQRSYNEESAALLSLLQDIEARCRPALPLLHAEPFVAALTAANNEFRQAMSSRHDDNAARQCENLRDLRAEADSAYRRAIAAVNAAATLYGEADYADFIAKLNERVGYYNLTLSARKTKSDDNEQLTMNN